MPYLPYTIFVFAAAFLAHRAFKATQLKSKRRHVEDQLHAFIGRWLRTDSGTDGQIFKETKQLLMLDWTEVHPQQTRMDFCQHFDKLVDGHCESFAITEYLRRRHIAASNDASVATEVATMMRSA